jgi:hypothetical protein
MEKEMRNVLPAFEFPDNDDKCRLSLRVHPGVT